MMLISCLKKSNIESIYFCSGSRNNSLQNILGEFKLKHRFDERSASFEALGEAKVTGKPVAICMTSGTAVSECLPAMIEAYYSDIPLVIISADRPAYLRKSHAPQAINQLSIFQNFTRFQTSSELGQFNFGELRFPAHINIEIEDGDTSSLKRYNVKEIKGDELSKFIQTKKNILLLISDGHNLTPEAREAIKKSSICLYTECLANIQIRKTNIIKKEDLLIERTRNGDFDLILSVGRTPLTKLWRIIERESIAIDILGIKKEKIGLSRGFFTNDNVFSLLGSITIKGAELAQMSPTTLNFEGITKSEPAIIQSILSTATLDDIIFAGNSMPIRYVEMLHEYGPTYLAARGANGIDGQLATVIGIAANTSKKVIAILGDLTFMYDFANILRSLPENLEVHVIQNNGGRIFERVQVKKEMLNEHSIDLKKMMKNLALEQQIIVHDIDNEQTQEFWKRRELK